MHEINIGATIANKRREAGITQDELAGRLGVTKAAVSKWELGQSLPDVALLPRIAAYFRLTLDELFDYRPQMGEDELRDVYFGLLREFSEDPAAAYKHVDALVADYYSCWPLLQQMAALYVTRIAVEPDRKDELAAKAMALVDRIEACSEDENSVRTARFFRATVLSMQGNLDQAIVQLEALRAGLQPGVEPMLASFYQQAGGADACLALHQELLFRGMTGAMTSITSLLPLRAGNREALEALLRVGDALVEGFDLAQKGTTFALGFWGYAASACAGEGWGERAAGYLTRFVGCLEQFDIADATAAQDFVLFDRIPHLVSSDPRTAEAAELQFAPVDFTGQYKLAVTASDAWAAYADDPSIAPLLKRLEDL